MGKVYEEFSPITPMWAVYLCILILCLVFQILSTFGLIRLAWKTFRRCGNRKDRTVKKPVAAIVACYLPNEEKIIKGTIEHILNETKDVEKFDVHVVYNTPHDMPELEAELQQMTSQKWPEGRQLFVERVMQSTSKAHNLNYVLPKIQSDYIVIYDADHHPDPDSLSLAVNYLEDNNLDCVQGSTYIRQQGLLASLVHGEFFVTYFVTLPIMAELTGLGFFAGSNAVWSRNSLQTLEFDHSMLTEDIDMSVRSVLRKQLTIAFLPESRSGELAPAGLRALWKQRLRWAIGWDQVTLRYTAMLPQLPWGKRLALYYILVCRYPALFCALIIVIFNVAYSLACFLNTESENLQPESISKAQLLSGRLFFLNVIFAYVQILIQERSLKLLIGVSLYMWLLPAILMCNAAVLMTSLAKLTSGGSTPWVVTTRGGSGQPEMPTRFRLLSLPAASKRTAWWILGIAFIFMGGLCGALIGRYLGMSNYFHRKAEWWDLVIYGSSTTYNEHVTVDGRIVVFSCFVGVLSGILLFILMPLCFRKIQHRDQPLGESMIAMVEPVARESSSA